MPTPVIQFAESNGASPTVTNNTTYLAFAGTDTVSTSSSSASNPITAGNNSYEKWIRALVNTASTNTLSAFGVYFSSTTITDAGSSTTNVVPYFGVNTTYATPVATNSTAATTTTLPTTAGTATAFTAPSNTASAYSAYTTYQIRVNAATTGGNLTFVANWLNFGYSYS